MYRKPIHQLDRLFCKIKFFFDVTFFEVTFVEMTFVDVALFKMTSGTLAQACFYFCPKPERERAQLFIYSSKNHSRKK
jgi:hypothetical protein